MSWCRRRLGVAVPVPVAIAFVLALALGGCGFRLQGSSAYPPSMATTYIAAEDRYSEFYRGLRASLEQGGVTLVASPAAATTVIRIEEDRTGQEVLTVSARNVPTEYDVYYVVRYSVWREGEEVLPARSLVQRQDYTYDANTVLGKQREERMLREAIAAELVRQVSLQLTRL